MSNTIRLLTEARFSAFLRWLNGTGSDANDEAGREATCVAMLDHPDTHQPTAFYVKFSRGPQGRSHALANEVLGYIYAHHFGLAQPPRACIARVPLNKIERTQIPKQHAWLRDFARNNDFYYAFCTEAVSKPTPWVFFGPTAIPAMADDLRLWPDLAKALAFDDVIANVDRHMNNLLRIGKASYALIDHGRLVTPDGRWSIADLVSDRECRNRLLENLFPDARPISNPMVAAIEGNHSLLNGSSEVNQWVGAITDSDEAGAAIDNFVKLRTISAPERIAKRYALC